MTSSLEGRESLLSEMLIEMKATSHFSSKGKDFKISLLHFLTQIPSCFKSCDKNLTLSFTLNENRLIYTEINGYVLKPKEMKLFISFLTIKKLKKQKQKPDPQMTFEFR